MKKWFFGVLTALVLCLTLLPTAALADTTPTGTALTQENISNYMTLTGGNSETEMAYYYLSGNVTVSESINVTGYVTLDLNGHVLKMAEGSSGSVIKVESGSLTLKDSDKTKPHYFTVDDTGLWKYVSDTKPASGEYKTVKGGIITGGNATETFGGGGVYVGGSFTMEGGSIVGCTARGGGGVYVNGGFTMNGGSIVGCTATYGGGVYTNNSFTMNGGSIENCTATGENGAGGGVCVNKNGFTLYNGTIKNCRAGRNGGGVYVNDNATSNISFTMSGGSIENCTVKDKSSNVYVDSRSDPTGNNVISFTMTGGTITGGTGTGGVHLGNDDHVFGCTMYANGGTINDTVYVNKCGTITRSDDAQGYTTFNGTVTGNGTIDDSAKLTVTFNYNDGTNTSTTQKVLKGQKATKPTDPTRDGYVFAGWSQYEWLGAENLDEEDDYLFSFDTPITKDLTLKALWQRKLSECTVTVDTLPYTGKAQTPSVAITDGDKTLEMGHLKDYIFLEDGNSVTSATDPGTYELTIRGTWAYCGDVTVYWTIAAPTGSDSEPSYSVTLPGVKNGTVKSDRRTAEAGDTVTLTVTPDAGYTLEALTVTDKNGRAVSLTDRGNGKYSFKMPDGKVTVTATFMDDNTMLNFFTDVTADKYFYDAVLWAAENGITGGVDDTRFAPNATCTRAQLVTFLYRYVQSQGGGFTGAWMFQLPFGDVPEWCYESVAWCYMRDIVGGYGDGTFGTGDTVTRQQAVTMLYRFAVAMGMDVSVGADTNILSYNDAFDVAEYAVEAFQWAVGAGIVQGNDGYLNPTAPCTRAQIVTFLYRLLGE